jgi:hypothetical protein
VPVSLSATWTDKPEGLQIAAQCSWWATYLDRYIYCHKSKFPTPVIDALMDLGDDPTNLGTALEEWNDWDEGSAFEFIDAVAYITGETCIFCAGCSEVSWQDDATRLANGESVCETCRIDDYSLCSHCEEWYSDDETTSVGSSTFCNECVSEHCFYCSWCEDYFTEATSIGDNYYCERCRDNHFTYCDECSEWYSDDDEHNHDHGCDCVAPHMNFEFPADGHGTISQDERLTVELPRGTIDDEGIRRIEYFLREDLGWSRTHIVKLAIEAIGPEWQTKRGNFTRRLSSALFKAEGIKLKPEVISEIGNIAQAHSSQGATWHIEFTRDLNQSASDFYHDESCWWQSYSASRCALKNWGGIGLRTYYSTQTDSSSPSGRIWVQPLAKTDDGLKPTHDALHADAYVLFNGYGDLSGYVAARIVAHLAGRTYRRVTLSTETQYINNDAGYLVADEATCEATERLYFGFDEHDRRDAHTYLRKEVAA